MAGPDFEPLRPEEAADAPKRLLATHPIPLIYRHGKGGRRHLRVRSGFRPVTTLTPPRRCLIWRSPDVVDQKRWSDLFEHLETFEETSHYWRHLLECRECGQRYFYEFYEEIDWSHGHDAQYGILVAVTADKDLEILKQTDWMTLLAITPRLQIDFPDDADKRCIRWIRGVWTNAAPQDD